MKPRGKPFTSETAKAAGKKSRRKPFDQVMREMLEKDIDGAGINTNEAMFRALRKVAMRGTQHSTMAAKELWNRGYGSARQNIEFTGKDGEAIKFEDISKKNAKDIYEAMLRGDLSSAKEDKDDKK